ncbi:MAG: hypothetical protein ABI037_11295 [Gemmatimonadales bacterium]
MNHKHIATGVLVLSLVACRDKAAAKMELKAMPMLPAFRAHLDSVAQHPAMMRAAMPEHRSEVKELVDAMRSDMTMMGMHSDAAYEALADSVVEGSAALGTAGGADFNRQVARHVDQLRRLAANYETKTAGVR